MRIYLVGGAVRDELLGLPIKERDWVVIGATPEEMIAQGFKPVGKDFPVFLHPDTHEEYALARTERKIGRGYHGFTFYTGCDVTLEQDLQRRDLTINAIAKDEAGTLIDPYDGQQDIKAKCLRHVSDAFREDPVRLLRLCRFAARFSDFTIANTTLTLLKQMVYHGEVAALVPERVFNELSKALTYPHPNRFFEILLNCDAFAPLFPEADRRAPYAALKEASTLTEEPAIRFAATFCRLDLDAIETLCQRLSLPKRYHELCQLSSQYRHTIHQIETASSETCLTLLEQLDFFRRPERFKAVMTICHADAWQQSGCPHYFSYAPAEKLTAIATACQLLDTSMIDASMSGYQIAAMIRQQRLQAAEIALQQFGHHQNTNR